MSKTTILVTAAAGTTSNAVARHLLAHADKSKVTVRVGARSKDKIQDLIQQGAEYVRLDFFDKDSVKESLKGVDRLWVTIPNPPKDNPKPMQEIVADFIDLVKESNVQHIVLGTVEGPEIPELNIAIAREFRLVEQRIQQHNIPCTYIRMGWFQENILTYHGEEIKQNVYVEPIGDHAYTQVSVEDIGEAGAVALLHPEGKVGKTYVLTGAKAVTGKYLAELLTEVLGRPIQFVSPTVEEMAEGLKPYMTEDQIKMALELYEMIRTDMVAHVSNDFTALTGKQYLPIEERFKQLKEAGLLA